MKNGATINLFSATSLSYLIVNQDISLIKISWPITFFYIAEYSTAWFSFNSFYHSLARRPWVEPSASPEGTLVLLCLDTWLLFLQEGSPHTGLLGWWEHHSKFESIISDIYQLCCTDLFSHQQLWILSIFWTFSSFIGGKCIILRHVCVCVCVCVQLLRCVRLFANPWTVVHQAPLVHGIFQARVFKWVAISFSRGSSQPRDLTCIYCVFALAAGLFTTEPPGSQLLQTLIFIQHGLHLCALQPQSVCICPQVERDSAGALAEWSRSAHGETGHLCHCFLLYVFETVSWLLIPCRWSVVFFHFILFAFSLISAILIWWH